ncbi:MAG: tetraacyldisaccharide 4'-kinase [Bacteroidales bacterium]|nr:tetraacyldisaccharide 4'-kinase [Bacteroidales bacterium]
MSLLLSKIFLAPYYLTLKVRNSLYDNGTFTSTHYDIPIICVGNVTAGGTGKTPMTEYIAKYLSREKRVAVLSRGYKRKRRGYIVVDENDNAKMVGDEPLQIKRKFPEVTVAVCKNRNYAINRLLALSENERPEVIILDDALQHRSVSPSKTIALISYNRPVFKDNLLPIGKLRDLPNQIRRAQTIVITKSPGELDQWEREKAELVNKVRKDQLLLFSTINYLLPQPVFKDSGNARYIYSKEVVLLTGIAENKPLINYLIGSYDTIHTISLGDHHNFTRSDIRNLRHISRKYSRALLLTTEKDAQRLQGNRFVSDELKQKLFYLPIEIQFLTPEEDAQFRQFIQ